MEQMEVGNTPLYNNGLMQKVCNSSVLAMELHLFLH